jgi:hypothetical protein
MEYTTIAGTLSFMRISPEKSLFFLLKARDEGLKGPVSSVRRDSGILWVVRRGSLLGTRTGLVQGPLPPATLDLAQAGEFQGRGFGFTQEFFKSTMVVNAA